MVWFFYIIITSIKTFGRDQLLHVHLSYLYLYKGDHHLDQIAIQTRSQLALNRPSLHAILTFS